MTETSISIPGDGSRAFFYDSEQLSYDGYQEYAATLPEADREEMFGVLGRTLKAAEILRSPTLSLVRVRVDAGETVKPHRHGTHQITYVLRGSLHYGNRVTGPGMGYFSPNRKYSWTAGPDGAEFLEIHAGEPQAIVPD